MDHKLKQLQQVQMQVDQKQYLCLLIDEAAFIENIGEIWASAQQTLATGGGCIALSTPYGTGNWFHQTLDKSRSS